MTLSCAHLRWPELFQILARIQGDDLTDKQVDTLSCKERCPMLNLNSVIVAKHTRKESKHSSLKCCSLMLNWLVKYCTMLWQLSFDCCSCCGRSRPMQDQNARYEARMNASWASSYWMRFCDIQYNQGRGRGYQPKPKAEAYNPYQDLGYPGYQSQKRNLTIRFILHWAKQKKSTFFVSALTANKAKRANVTWLLLEIMHRGHTWHDHPWPRVV